jgi:hypothetical protein
LSAELKLWRGIFLADVQPGSLFQQEKSDEIESCCRGNGSERRRRSKGPFSAQSRQCAARRSCCRAEQDNQFLSAKPLAESLQILTEAMGKIDPNASRAYHASLHAVAGPKSLIHQLGIACEMRDKQSLYLAAGETSKKLLKEHQLRERAGLPGDFLDHGMLLGLFGIARAGAIVSPGAADADPTQLARGLLRVLIGLGSRRRSAS